MKLQQGASLYYCIPNRQKKITKIEGVKGSKKRCFNNAADLLLLPKVREL